MVRKITPINFGESASKIAEQLNVQSEKRTYPKSLDPENFPVFDPQVEHKYLIYVPKHVVVDEKGTETLLMDRPLIHTVITPSGSYEYHRCTNGITAEEFDLDGSCPLCDGVSEPWDLANIQITNECSQMGLDPNDKENETVKSIRSRYFNARVIDSPRRYYTFPIVVFDTVNNDGKTLAVQDGNLSYRPMWYHVSQNFYDEKWGKFLEGVEDEPTHPGGMFLTLNFCYNVKSGSPNKRDAVRNMGISLRTKIGLKDTTKLCEMLDKLTESWTPMKAQETVISNIISPNKILLEIADDALVDTRSLIAMNKALQLSGGASPAGSIETKDKLVPPTDGGTSPNSALDETDLDVDI